MNMRTGPAVNLVFLYSILHPRRKQNLHESFCLEAPAVCRYTHPTVFQCLSRFSEGEAMLKDVSVGEAMKRKYPEAVAWATSVDEEGNPNALALGWCMCTSNDPPMLAISVGLTRYSHELIEKAGEFVVVFPSETMADATRVVGTRSGRDGDKMADAGVTLAPATQVRPPLVDDACANFECKLAGTLRTGDHTIFAGEVVAAHVGPESARRIYTLGGDRGFRPVVPAE
jgi:flavin reductase (DIM6/NTAB) family NADH-FMN oxidoreductase RutF